MNAEGPGTSPLVSITSTVYNTGPYLLDMIKSILAQTFTDFEFVLVDDGSTDGGLELARSVADQRVRVYSNGRNRGRSYSYLLHRPNPDLLQSLVVQGPGVSTCHAPLYSMSTYLWPD